jgi:hypothetical protein
VAGSTRFCGRVRVQGNGPRASRLRASGVRVVQELCAGDANGRGDPAGSYAGVPAVFQRHMCVSRGSSTREQENPEVREGVGIVNQSGPIGFFLESTTSNSSYPSPIVRARPQHLKKAREPSYRAFSNSFARTSSLWQSQLLLPRITVRNIPPAILHPLQLPGKLLRHPRNLVTVELFSSPILFAMGNSLSTRSPPQPKLPQGLP